MLKVFRMVKMLKVLKVLKIQKMLKVLKIQKMPKVLKIQKMLEMPKMHNMLNMLIVLKILGAQAWQQSISYFDVVAGLKDAWHNNKWTTAIFLRPFGATERFNPTGHAADPCFILRF